MQEHRPKRWWIRSGVKAGDLQLRRRHLDYNTWRSKRYLKSRVAFTLFRLCFNIEPCD
jgi:hypothetical protein